MSTSLTHSALISFAVYYRVYLSGGKGDKKAKTSFDESDISLGRINTLFIAPPHTAGSLKACIAKVEGLATPSHARYKDMELFKDVNSDTTMNDTDVISFLDDTYVGSDGSNPIALVNANGNVFSQCQQHRASANHFLSDGSDSNFTRRGQLIYPHVEEEATEVPATTSEVPTGAGVEEALATEEPAKEEAKPVCLFYFIFILTKLFFLVG